MQKKIFLSLSLTLLCMQSITFSMQKESQKNEKKKAVAFATLQEKNKQRTNWEHFKKSFAKFSEDCIDLHILS